MRKILILTILTVVSLSFISCGKDTEEEKKRGKIFEVDSQQEELPLGEVEGQDYQDVVDNLPQEDVKTVKFGDNQNENSQEEVETIDHDEAPAVTEEEAPQNENYAGIVEEQRVALVTNETGYTDAEAAEEIENVKTIVKSSEHWKQYCEYEDGQYAVDIDKFNIRRDGMSEYILDYSGKYIVNITVNMEDISIYVMDEYRNEIVNFTRIAE